MEGRRVSRHYPGRAISKQVILQKLSAMCDFFGSRRGLRPLAHRGLDGAGRRWRDQLAGDKPVRQGYKDFSPALETFERMLLNGEIAHAGHKVLTGA